MARYLPQAGRIPAGTVPFVDVAGQLVAVTSGFSPSLLAGLSQAQIAAVVADPTPGASASSGSTAPPTGQAVIAVANQLSAGICAATGQQPAAVCRSKGVRDRRCGARTAGAAALPAN